MRDRMIDNFDAKKYDKQHPDKSLVPKFNYLKLQQERKQRILGIKAARERAATFKTSDDEGQLSPTKQRFRDTKSTSPYVFQNSQEGRGVMGQIKISLKN